MAKESLLVAAVGLGNDSKVGKAAKEAVGADVAMVIG